MKKKILTITTALVLVCAIAIGATVAYFLDTEKVQNSFTVGNVAISLDEAPVERTEDPNNPGVYTYEADDEAPRVQTNTYDVLYPGAQLPKDPTVHNDGQNASKLLVVIDIDNAADLLALDEYTTAADLYSGNNAIIKNLNLTDFDITVAQAGDATYAVPADHIWLVMTYKTNNGNFQVNADVNVFDGMTFPTSLTNETFATLNDLSVDVTAYAVQAEAFPGFETCFPAIYA